MHAGTALLSVFLAGPAQSPTPVEDLLDVAELAERRLAAAIDLDEVGELLTHVGTAREIAHGRTGAPDHLCRLLDAAGSVLARPGLPANLRAEALDFTNRAHATLSTGHPGHTCVAEAPAELLPVVREPAVAWTRPPAEVVDRPKIAPMTLAGGVLRAAPGVRWRSPLNSLALKAKAEHVAPHDPHPSRQLRYSARRQNSRMKTLKRHELGEPHRSAIVFTPFLATSTTDELHAALALIARSARGGCLTVVLEGPRSPAVKALGDRLAAALHALRFPPSCPLVQLVADNVGKALGGYASRFGRLPLTLIVLDEVSARGARFVQIGRMTEQMVPVSFYGLASANPEAI